MKKHMFHTVIRSLLVYKGRTFLAILGVTFGAFILTLLLNIAEAMVLKTKLEIEKLGPNVVTVMSGTVGQHTNSEITSFTLQDYKEIALSSADIQAITPFSLGMGFISFQRKQVQTGIVATEAQYTKVRSLPLLYGSFFSDEQVEKKSKVIVLGYAIAKALVEQPKTLLGKTVLLLGVPFKVIGVGEELGQSPTGEQPDAQVYIPITTYMRRVVNKDYITGVYLRVKQDTKRDILQEGVTQILRKNHALAPQEENDFVFFSAQETLNLQDKTLRLVRSIGILVATLSFAIGALGILSIMIVLVRIRRTEIGIRRAVGATYADIVRQFLYEAISMSFLGGVSGVLLALGILSGIYALGLFPAVYQYTIIAGAIASSLLVGLIAGVYPAVEGAKIGIITVLKNSNT